MAPDQPAQIAYRVGRLEQEMSVLRQHTDARLDKVEGRVNTLVMAVVGATLTVAVSVTVFTVTVLVGSGGTP